MRQRHQTALRCRQQCGLGCRDGRRVRVTGYIMLGLSQVTQITLHSLHSMREPRWLSYLLIESPGEPAGVERTIRKSKRTVWYRSAWMHGDRYSRSGRERRDGRCVLPTFLKCAKSFGEILGSSRAIGTNVGRDAGGASDSGVASAVDRAHGHRHESCSAPCWYARSTPSEASPP